MMPDRPILIFPTVTVEDRTKRPLFVPPFSKPTAAQQHQRLHRRFQSIAQGFGDLQPRVDGLDPELVIVLEALGSITDVARRAQEIPGLEWLSELDLEEADPGDGFVNDNPQQKLPCRLFAAMTNEKALNKLLGLWGAWVQAPDERAKKGFGPFKELFSQLKDVRRWGVKDRLLDTGVEEYWRENLEFRKDPVRFEAELWFRANVQRRQQASDEIARLVGEAGGARIAECQIAAIRYHGVLLELPPNSVEATLRTIQDNDFGPILRCEEVMFYRPRASAVSVLVDEEPQEAGTPVMEGQTTDAPIVALLDGLPLENHEALRGRLIVDDPDGFADNYRPQQQQHGTAMASLIVHGDLQEARSPLAHKVYSRPILIPREHRPDEYAEEIPNDRLFVDLIHHAVRRIVEADGTEPAAAPTVRIVNLSVANPWQLYDRQLSPLAKLLDWLAWKHKLLFVVAVGNHVQDIGFEATKGEYSLLNDDQVVQQCLSSLSRDQAKRRLMSPSETVNGISVGALHADASTGAVPGMLHDLLRGRRLPSPVNTVSGGCFRSVKPEILLPGGRQLYAMKIGLVDRDHAQFEVTRLKRPPGQKVACPGGMLGELNRFWYDRGTSNATALATRHAALIFERLLSLRGEPGGDGLTDDLLHVLTKALLVHGALWSDGCELLRELLPSKHWHAVKGLQSRFWGFGETHLDRSTVAADERVLLLGGATIKEGQGHVYTLPLPSAMNGTKHRRRLVTTVAWMTPINPQHHDYRKAALSLTLPAANGFADPQQVDDGRGKRGTVQHRVFESEKAVAYADGEQLVIKVSCREAAKKLTESVPYGLAVTLEFAEPVGINIYDEIRDVIRPRVRVGAESEAAVPPV